jgi:hypothetical protein
MTAPLPPLPAIPLPNGYPVEEHGVIAKFAQDFAKLAVREALLKVAAAVSAQQENGGDCVMSIRAMMKEYE